MKRNIFAYSGFAGVLLMLAPRSFAWRRFVWCRYLPWAETSALVRWSRNWIINAIFRPRLWWLCRRLDLHLWFGLPMPRTKFGVEV